MVYQNGKAVAISQVSASSGFAQDIYSTEEQVIGRWIDGRQLYRKVYHLNDFTVGAHTDVEITSDIAGKTFFKTFGYLLLNGSQQIQFPYAEGTQFTVSTSVFQSKLWLFLRLSGGAQAASNCYVVVEYTKTTDEATIPDNATYLSGYPASINRSDSTFQVNLQDTLSPTVLPVTTSISNNEEAITDV